MKPSRGQQTRTRIAEAALELLREKGSAGLTMRQAAHRAGLSLSNVQYHYASRTMLVIGITQHHLKDCAEALEQALHDAPTVGLHDILNASLCDDRVLQTAPPFRELFAAALTEPAVHEHLMAYYRSTHVRLTTVLRSAYPENDSPIVDEAATLIMTAIEGAYLLDTATPVSRQRLAHRLEQVVHALLSNGPADR